MIYALINNQGCIGFYKGYIEKITKGYENEAFSVIHILTEYTKLLLLFRFLAKNNFIPVIPNFFYKNA